VRMVADVTETRIVIPSLEFKTCMTIRRKHMFNTTCIEKQCTRHL